MTAPENREGTIYGGLLLTLHDNVEIKPVAFPFDVLDQVKRGNHIKEHTNLVLNALDYWHGGENSEALSLFMAERGVGVEGLMVGHNCTKVLKETSRRLLTINSGVKPEDRPNMLEAVSQVVFPTITQPAFISMIVQSKQPKFVMLSRDIPIHINVFCDDAMMLMVWTNEHDLDKRMRERYGERFSVFRMQPIVDSAVVIHSLYLRKKLTRWRHEMRDRLRMLNALEAMLGRRTKSDANQVVNGISTNQGAT